MHNLSRILSIALLVALLPLRGWMGDAAAVEAAFAAKITATQVNFAGTSGSLTSEPAMANMPDCPGRALMQAQVGNDADVGADAGCPGCNHCQLCQISAMLPVTVQHAITTAFSAPPLGFRAAFASADAVPGFKPPIS